MTTAVIVREITPYTHSEHWSKTIPEGLTPEQQAEHAMGLVNHNTPSNLINFVTLCEKQLKEWRAEIDEVTRAYNATEENSDEQ